MAQGSSISVLDGHETIGGTKILVESGGTQILLDFGTNFKQWGRFFDEFTQPRTSRGIADFLATDLVPRRGGWYRPDLFSPRDRESPELKDLLLGRPPDAVLLSHAHLDHCGALSILNEDVPVLCTPITLALLRAMQETGGSNTAREYAFTLARGTGSHPLEPGCSDPDSLLESMGENRSRPFQIFGDIPGTLVDLVTAPPFPSNEWDPTRAVPKTAGRAVGSIRIEHFPVDHSLYGAAAFVLDLDGARVAYTGDLRMAGDYAESTRQFVQALGRNAPDVLLVEGTRLRKSKDEKQIEVSEAQVEKTAESLVAQNAGKFIVADFGPRNIERLLTFLRVARATGRTMVITPKDAFVLWAMAQADPQTVPIRSIQTGEVRILEEPSQSSKGRWSKVVWGYRNKPPKDEVAAARAEGRPRPLGAWVDGQFPGSGISARELSQDPSQAGKYLLCFSVYDCNDLVDLRKVVQGGVWIYSSSEAHSEEQEVDFVRLKNWIDWARMSAVGFSLEANARGGFSPKFDSPPEGPLHASGHAAEAELVELIRASKAKWVVPVHTESPGAYRNLFADRKVDAKLVLPAECKDRVIPI